MDKEGPQNEGNEQGSPASGNVVRLPRDWLGPRDELIPLGPLDESEAVALDPDSDSGSASRPPTPPPSAEDFWGEGSAEVQDALQRPAVPAATPRAAAHAGAPPHRARRRVPRLRRRVQWRRWSVLPAASTGDPTAGTRAIGTTRPRPRPRPRPRSVAIAALVAVACTGLLVRVLDMSGASSFVGSNRGALTHRTLPFGGWQLPALRPSVGRGHHPAHRQPRTKHSVRTQRSRRRPTNVVVHAAPSYATPATYTPPASQSANPGSVSSPGTGSSGGGSGAPAGPVGAGAPFGPGHLG